MTAADPVRLPHRCPGCARRFALVEDQRRHAATLRHPPLPWTARTAAEVGAATLEERRLAVHAHNTVNDLLRRARQAAGALVGA